MLHIHSENKLLDSGVVNNIGNWFFKIAVTLIPLMAYLAEIAHLHESVEGMFSSKNIQVYITLVNLIFALLIFLLGEPTSKNWDENELTDKIQKSDYYKNSTEHHKSILNDKSHINSTIMVLKTYFSKYWIYMWVTWAFLYLILVCQKLILNTPDANAPVSYSEILITLLTNCLSYLNSFCILTLYLVLIYKFDVIKKEKDRNILFNRFANRGLLIVGLLVFAEMTIYLCYNINDGIINRNRFDSISTIFGIVNGLLASICFTFLISRLVGSLTTEFKGKNIFFLPFLYLYCAIQPLYPYIAAFHSETGNEEIKISIKIAILIIALFGKYILYYVITSLFESRKILYHFLETNAITSRIHQSSIQFEDIWKTKDGKEK